MALHTNLKIIFGIAIIFTLFSPTFMASCRSDRFCMACSETTENQCDACFNWANSVHLPRAINASSSPQDCITPLSLTISGCKWYSGLDTTTTASRAVTTCNICSREFLRWNATNNTAHCTEKLPFGFQRINNCLTTIQFETTLNTTSGCRMCKKNYSGSGWDTVNGAGSKQCVQNRAITNCAYNYMQSDSSYECYVCDKNYAVSSTKTSCISFTVDPNCRSQHLGSGGCYYCWHAYYWDSDSCKLKSEISNKTFWVVAQSLLILNVLWVRQ